MASVDDVPPDLRPLARKVPHEYREKLTPVELSARCEEAAELFAQADRDENRVKRKQADRFLSAMPMADLTVFRQAIEMQIREAELNEAALEAGQLRELLSRLDRENPQPYERLIAAYGEQARELARNVQEDNAKTAGRWPRLFRALFRKGN